MIEFSKYWLFILFAVILLMLFSSKKTYTLMNTYLVKSYTPETSYTSAEGIKLTNMFFQNLMQNNQTGLRDLSNIALSSPWLFPKSQALFPYLGMHNDLDTLLKTMAYPSKKIIILTFNWHWQSMAQNNIFTLVRFTRTFNYIVATGDEITLLVCIELNLPCYNASSYMLNLKTNVSMKHQGLFNDPYYLTLVWYLIPFYLDILRKGFIIMKSDTDISYAGKDIWQTFELMIEKTEADLIFMRESPVNTGQFYAIPNDRVIAFFEEWIASKRVFEKQNDQQVLSIMNGKIYKTCNSKDSCNRVKTLLMQGSSDYQLRVNNQDSKMAAVLTYPSSFTRFGGICPPNKKMDPCNQDILYVHTICMTGAQAKIDAFKRLGFWLMTDPCTNSKLDVPFRSAEFVNISLTRCVPIPRLWPTVENSFLRCNDSNYVVPI
jgi:hypothetical protein